MGRRRRKIVKRVIRPLPRVFVCPVCNEEAVAVYHENGAEYAKVVCANCRASAEVRWFPSYMPVDAYAEFYDIITGAKKPVESRSESEESGGEPTSTQARDGESEVSKNREN